MDKLFIFTGTIIGGYALWYLGDWCGLDFMGCFVLSGAGSVAGVFAGWKVAQHFK